MERIFFKFNKEIFSKRGDLKIAPLNNTYNWNLRQRIFNIVIFSMGIFIIIILAGILITLFYGSFPALKKFGLNFFINKEWDPVFNKFGSLPVLIGTLLTSFIALFISIFFSLSISILLGEYFKKGGFSNFIKTSVELLAAVPSVIYGFWGLFVIVPLIRTLEIKLTLPSYGVGIFTASLILAIMIIPYAASIGREMIELVPSDIKEAAYALGATRYEVIKKVILPYSKSGIIAGVFLALGRALGETMAVTMLIGNSNFIPKTIFHPCNTMASVIANEFTEATTEIYTSSLIEIGLILFFVTVIINLIGKYIIKKFTIETRRENG